MKISNEQTKVSKGKKFNDKDYLNNILSILKDLEKNYTVALTEFSNEIYFQKIKKDFDKIALMQRKTFELAFANGWYELKTAENAAIKTSFTKNNQEFADLFTNTQK